MVDGFELFIPWLSHISLKKVAVIVAKVGEFQATMAVPWKRELPHSDDVWNSLYHGRAGQLFDQTTNSQVSSD